MILILGNNADDIIYIKTKMDIERVDEIALNHPVYVGVYSGKDIVLTYTKPTNTVSSIITALCIEKYRPYIVISIGSVSAYNEILHQGDILLVERIYNGDVDLTTFGSVKYGQIVGLPEFYTSEDDYISMVETINSRSINHNIHRASLISTNKFYTSKEAANELINLHFAAVDRIGAFDTELGGIASACAVFDTPWLAIKSVNYVIGHDNELLTFVRKGIENEPIVGSLISSLFNNLIYSIEN
jgi:adenosylhomocysteine nucleosidase